MPTARSPDAGRQPQGEIRALTSLRGLAACAVVLQHFSATAQATAATTIPSLVPHGYMAVDFFFVLSGFIMAYTYLASFETSPRRAYPRFLYKRVARICPLGIAVTAIVLLLAGVASLFGRADLFLAPSVVQRGVGWAILVNVLHLQGILPDYSLNDPSWSVSVEFVAYVLFPFLIYLAFAAPRLVTLAFAVAGVAAVVAVALFDPQSFAGRSPASNLGRCLGEFGFGLLIYRAYKSGGALCRLGEDRWTWVVTAICLCALLLRSDVLAAASFPFLVLAYAVNRGVPSRLASARVPYFLGTISFSIYLVHNLFRLPESALLSWVVPPPHPAPLALAFALFGSVSVLPFATLAFMAIERPGRSLIAGLLRSQDKPAPLAPALAGPYSPPRGGE